MYRYINCYHGILTLNSPYDLTNDSLVCNWTEVSRQREGSAVAVPAFKPPKIADSSNTNQRLSVSKFYLDTMWEGTNPRLGRTILNLVIGTILKSIQQKDK